jgi:uroporphyrinogen III methyltransferase/synthase
MLEDEGAEVLAAPTVEIQPVEDLGRVDDALRDIRSFDWLILTSVNGVDAVLERLAHLHIDASVLRAIRVAVIGPATAERLRAAGLEPEVVPEAYVAESLAEAVGQSGVAGKRCLLLRSDIARVTLRTKLMELGAVCEDLPVYRTCLPDALPSAVLERLRAGEVGWLTFTSSSTFRNLIRLLGAESDSILRSVRLASIGPITSEAIRSVGFLPTIEAAEYTIPGLVAAICESVEGGLA